LKNNNIFKLNLKEKILFLISIVLLSFGWTFPLGLMILLLLALRIGKDYYAKYPKRKYLNTDFVN